MPMVRVHLPCMPAMDLCMAISPPHEHDIEKICNQFATQISNPIFFRLQIFLGYMLRTVKLETGCLVIADLLFQWAASTNKFLTCFSDCRSFSFG